MSSGLRATATDSFTTEFSDDTVPPQPSAGIDLNDVEYTAEIYPACYDQDADGNDTTTLTSGVTLSVYRIGKDGDLTEIATGIANNGSGVAFDPHPLLGVEAAYRIVVINTSSGLMNYDEVPYILEYDNVLIQWDESWKSVGDDGEELYTGALVELPYNPEFSNTFSPDVTLSNFIGNTDPTSSYGTQKGRTASWSIDIPWDDTDTYFAMERLACYSGDCYIRSQLGDGFNANIQVVLTASTKTGMFGVALTISRVRGGA
jgi:hypothetical protein